MRYIIFSKKWQAVSLHLVQNKWRAIFSARARDRLDIGGNLEEGGGGEEVIQKFSMQDF
jgi:hypothetical protein